MRKFFSKIQEPPHNSGLQKGYMMFRTDDPQLLGATVPILVARSLFAGGLWCYMTAAAAATTSSSITATNTALQLHFIDRLINCIILKALHLWNWFCYNVKSF